MFTKAIKRTMSGMPGTLLFVSILVSALFPSRFVSSASVAGQPARKGFVTMTSEAENAAIVNGAIESNHPGFANYVPGTDWSKAMVESTMTRFTPSTIGGWSYPIGLYLHGQYLVYKRTGDSRYLQYIKSWADRFVSPSGGISNSFNNLDSMLSGIVLLDLYQETGQAKYRIAADKIRRRFNTPAACFYPILPL